MEKLDLGFIKDKSNEILATLPIAHYLKVDTIKIVFDESADTSFFNPISFDIHIALSNIVDAINGSDKEKLTELDLEKHIRCFLYHEISHAILTPTNLKSFVVSHYPETILTPNIVNILEDERIETILKDYYLLVNFEDNLHNICKAEKATSFEHFVFNAIRLKCCGDIQKDINNHLLLFIKATKYSNSTEKYPYTLVGEMFKLTRYLKTLYEEELSKDKEGDDIESPENNDSEKPSDTKGGKDESKAGTKPSDTKGEKPSSDDEKADDSSGDLAEGEGISVGISATEGEEAMRKAIEEIKMLSAKWGGRKMKLSDFTSDSKTKVELLKTIIRNKGVGVVEQQTQVGYCGRFNAKKFMKDHNDSYKWFEKIALEDSEMNGRKGNKKVLNIWLDQSGSFDSNDSAVNKVLKALAEIEERQPDFEWRLIKLTCNVSLVKNKEERFSQSFSGNALPVNKMKKVYNEVNANRDEFNLVLFDGNANSLDFGCGKDEERQVGETYSYKALKVFDNKRTIFITEDVNFDSISAICPNAKSIIRERSNYAGCLSANIVRALDLLF